MTINEGYLADAADVALQKGSFSAGALGAAGVTTQTLAPGPGSLAANAASKVPALGDQGLLVPAGVPVGAAVELPSVQQTLSKLSVMFLGSATGGDAAKTATFSIWVQRQTLQNASAVASNSAIPSYAPPAVAPVITPLATAAINVAAASGGVPTQVFVDISATPFVVQPGDVYFCAAVFSAALAGTITNVQVALG